MTTSNYYSLRVRGEQGEGLLKDLGEALSGAQDLSSMQVMDDATLSATVVCAGEDDNEFRAVAAVRNTRIGRDYIDQLRSMASFFKVISSNMHAVVVPKADTRSTLEQAHAGVGRSGSAPGRHLC